MRKISPTFIISLLIDEDKKRAGFIYRDEDAVREITFAIDSKTLSEKNRNDLEDDKYILDSEIP